MNIVVLAAGKGTRMRSDLPKVLHPVGHLPLLGHVLLTASALHPTRLIVVIGHGAEQVQQQCSDFYSNASSIRWALQDPPRGTGHAVQQAIDQMDRGVPTLILYGDVPLITSATLQRLTQAAKAHQDMAILTATLPNPYGYGRIVRDAQGMILRVVEEKDADPATRAIQEINTGILIAPTERLIGWLQSLTDHNAQGEYYLTDIIEMAAKEQHPIGSAQPETLDEIHGVNSQAQRAELERAFQRRQATALMDAGVRLMDPARIDIRGSLRCAANVVIDVGCVFEGQVVIDQGAEIGPHCVSRDATIVGKFVELKNTQLGPRSKANHLAYLGDASIGSRVNVGAGTITCNYDGAHKHRTVIEDDAFIGSDTQLVAPVTVGKGATLGAGTTLTQDAPAHELTLSRSPQVTVKGYKRPHKKAH